MVHAGGAWAADETLDLRVLVVSTGDASVDPGLDLMDDVLNEVGVPYDVLDSSTQALTADRLFSGDHGFYNGVILTNSELFLPDGGGSGFDSLEWETLHAFERDFGVRESIISGFPATNPGLGLDYGMTDIIAGTDFQGRWQAPAGGTEIYEYVNEANPLPITDFAFAGRPFVIYAGEPRETGLGPHVQPLLVWQNDTQKSFVSLSPLRRRPRGPALDDLERLVPHPLAGAGVRVPQLRHEGRLHRLARGLPRDARRRPLPRQLALGPGGERDRREPRVPA